MDEKTIKIVLSCVAVMQCCSSWRCLPYPQKYIYIFIYIYIYKYIELIFKFGGM